jgi:hypothetical protein
VLRLSPVSDAAEMAQVVGRFRRAMQGEPVRAAEGSSNGYWHGEAGMRSPVPAT